MSGHTPGPWALSSLGGPWEQQIRIRAENWGIVAHVGVDPSLPHWDEPQRANARLIAAAPELLEALGAVKHSLDCLMRETGRSSFKADVAASEMARAAIARATGENT